MRMSSNLELLAFPASETLSSTGEVVLAAAPTEPVPFAIVAGVTRGAPAGPHSVAFETPGPSCVVIEPTLGTLPVSLLVSVAGLVAVVSVYWRPATSPPDGRPTPPTGPASVTFETRVSSCKVVRLAAVALPIPRSELLFELPRTVQTVPS